jgi:hypothetical protein
LASEITPAFGVRRLAGAFAAGHALTTIQSPALRAKSGVAASLCHRTPKWGFEKWSVIAVLTFTCLSAPATDTLPSASSSLKGASLPGADLFKPGDVHRIQIQITSENLAALRKEEREFVRATVSDGAAIYSNVAVHLKGSIGSFRPLDDKPAWTLDFSRFNPDQKFHALRRIHLNNSVEDPSYCNEWLGSELFRKAGIPAPRVSYAVVMLNERRLGLYVLMEGFTEDFLSCYFKRVTGDLYEPGEGHDVNQRLKRNSVHADSEGRSGLESLAQAALETNPDQRWARMEKTLDTDQFITFMALEIVLCHRDGYCLARNNFRVYEDADSGKVLFFPHGMDQLFGNPDLPWKPHMAGLIAKAALETSEGKTLYNKYFGTIFTNLFVAPLLSAEVDRIVAGFRSSLPQGEFAGVQKATTALKERILARQLSLWRQLAAPQPESLVFKDGAVHLGRWIPADRPANGRIDETETPDGKPVLHILTQSETSASWKATALLDRGRYRFEGKAKVSGIKPLRQGIHQGAGLRLAGRQRQSPDLVGPGAWQTLTEEFEVDTDGTEIQFLCELRAEAGEAWFDLESLQVVRLLAEQ